MFDIINRLKAALMFRKAEEKPQMPKKFYQDLAQLLKTDANALKLFEDSYNKMVLNTVSENFFEVNAKQAVAQRETKLTETEQNQIVERIVNELLAQTAWYSTDGKTVASGKEVEPLTAKPVEREELLCIPEEMRPQLTGRYMTVDIDVPITTNSNIKPYVPSNRLTGEKAYTPRICVSKSLNGCLTSIGPAAIGTAAILHELCGTSSLCPEEQAQILDRLAFPYTILTFDIPADAPYLIQASQLENEVADA